MKKNKKEKRKKNLVFSVILDHMAFSTASLSSAIESVEMQVDKNKINIIAKDDVKIPIDLKLWKNAKTVMDQASEHPGADIPMLNIEARYINLINEYLVLHNGIFETIPETDKYRTDNIKIIDYRFISQINLETLFDLIVHVNYIDLKPLLELCLKIVAVDVKRRTTDEVGVHYALTNKEISVQSIFTPEILASLNESPLSSSLTPAAMAAAQ